MRVADRDRNAVAERACGDVEVQRVAGFRQRDGLPVGPDRAQIDTDVATSRRLRVNEPGRRLQADVAGPGLLHQQRGDAAGGIAAGADLAAVGIEDAHEGVRVRHRRPLDYDQLIAADPLAPVGNRPRKVRCHRNRARARVDDDEIVAESMHLGKGERIHASSNRHRPT